MLTGAAGDPGREAAAELARQHRMALDVYRVGSDAADLVDPAGAFLDLYGIDAGGAVLVRPDGFVSWRQKSLPSRPAAALRGALDHILAPS